MVLGAIASTVGSLFGAEYEKKRSDRLHKVTSEREYELSERSFDKRLGQYQEMGLTPQEIVGANVTGGGGRGSTTIGNGPVSDMIKAQSYEARQRDKDRATSERNTKTQVEGQIAAEMIRQGTEPDTMAAEQRGRAKELHKLEVVTKSPEFVREMRYAGMSPQNVRSLMALMKQVKRYPTIMQGGAPIEVYDQIERELVAIESKTRTEAHGVALTGPNTPNTCLLYTSPSPRDS